jgi:mRNA interferase YafQ
MLELLQTSTYKKQLKKYKHKNEVLKELKEVTRLLVNELPIPLKYKNHKLTGEYKGVMELHLKPDDLLMYIKVSGKSVTLIAIGSHAELGLA